MCGIAGVIKKGAREAELKEVIVRMNETQNRRGPDDSGVFVDEKNGLALGHTRLSILDLSTAGHQPMLYTIPNTLNSIPSLVITFNGEIYNFWELRKELESKGYQFKTKTDTEVIMAAYAEWGVESFAKLRGMFAFGLWDYEQKKLFLVKDRYGIKPLYYYSDKEKMVFASTVKALKVSREVPNNKNKKAVIGFLLFGSVPLPQTTLENVYGIPAGYYLEVGVDLSVKTVKYYEPLEYFLTSDDLSHNIGLSSVQSITQRTRSLLEESVRLHMISDAPLGIFLSGGIDSSVLAILAAANLGTSEVHRTSDVQNIGSNRLNTLSIIFDEQEYSEQKYQQIIAKQIHSNHHEYKVTKSDFFAEGESASGGENVLPDIWNAMDEPSIDGVNTYFVAQAAKKAGLKTVLSGLGADEIFFGYPSFRKAAMLRKVQKGLSIFGHRPPKFSERKFRWAMSRILGIFGDKYSKLQYLGSPTSLEQSDFLRFYLSIRGLFAPVEVAKILDISEPEVNNFIDSLAIPYTLYPKPFSHMHPANLLSYLELKYYLQNQLLKDSDFMAMHHGIEIRVPFLDHKLVEYVSSLPADFKLKNRAKGALSDYIGNKWLLIAAMLDGLPKEIYNRPKMGFTFPFQSWLTSQMLPVHGSKFEVSASRSHWSRIWAKEVLKKF